MRNKGFLEDAILMVRKTRPDHQHIRQKLVEKIKEKFPGKNGANNKEIYWAILPFGRHFKIDNFRPHQEQEDVANKAKRQLADVQRGKAADELTAPYLAWLSYHHPKDAEEVYRLAGLEPRKFEGPEPALEDEVVDVVSGARVHQVYFNKELVLDILSRVFETQKGIDKKQILDALSSEFETQKEIQKGHLLDLLSEEFEKQEGIQKEQILNTLSYEFSKQENVLEEKVNLGFSRIFGKRKYIYAFAASVVLGLITLAAAMLFIEKNAELRSIDEIELATKEREESTQTIIRAITMDRQGFFELVDQIVEQRKAEFPNLTFEEITEKVKTEFEKYLEYRESIGLIANDSSQDARLIARKEFDSGNFKAAHETLLDAVENWKKSQNVLGNLHLKQKQEVANNGLTLYVELASMARTQLEFEVAADYFEKAAELAGDGKGPLYRLAAVDSLYEKGIGFGDVKSLEKSLKKLRNLIVNIPDENETALVSSQQLLYAIMNSLANLSKDNKPLEEAEAMLRDELNNCNNQKVLKESCYRIGLSLSAILRNRGTRSTISDKGWQAHRDRLNDSVHFGKVAVRHSEILGENEKLKATLYLQRSLVVFGDFVGDTELRKTAEYVIYEHYESLAAEINEGKHGWLTELYILTCLDNRSFANEFHIENAISLLRKEIKGHKETKPYQWALYKTTIAFNLRRLWKLKDNLYFLEQGISEFEEAFTIIDEKFPKELAMNQINFAILVSDYGREKQDEKSLVKAARLLKAAADAFLAIKQFPDRRLALSNLAIVLRRLEQLSQATCLKETREIVESEEKNLLDYFNTSETLFAKENIGDSDLKKFYKRHFGLSVIAQITSKTFDKCFGDNLSTFKGRLD
ncbi:hypothetical protein [uncultured Sneathiella sp.]|uniref:hypothetical protein n=1 Tax=uncultured Sneathiella sp. TaxID=879315 RepID=UPI0030EE7D2E|tara:strand:- start:508 stop:3105 length:2598 start_codon:yes stop_codon:yes gene_type:complete